MFTVEKLQQIVNNELKNICYGEAPRELYEPVEYIMSMGGKRLRPVLVLMGCDLFGGNIQKAIKPALGIEIFHNFTLVHDDVMDNAAMRRNQATIHSKWDLNRAILSGDAMSILVYDYLIQCDTNILKEIIALYNRTALQVCEGQQLDMNFETRMDVSEQEYLQMIELKTSVLIACALKTGALIGGADIDNARYIYNFGKNIGLAFQLQDDYLDVYGDVKKFGKQIGGDIVSNKKTFLLIKALKNATGTLKTELEQWLNKKKFHKPEKIKAITEIYDKLQVKELSQQKMQEFYAEAMQALGCITVADNRKTELEMFAKKLMSRSQ